jgi:uncharacterized protein (DUF488 family)
MALLGEAGVDCLVDIRSIPRSRSNPQFNQDRLPAALAAYGIDYRHLAALGGRRGRRKEAPPSPNGFWQNAAFRNYADYALGPEFRSGLVALVACAGEKRCAMMCAEAVWWRCHRRIVADYLMDAGIAVAHIMGPGAIEPARPTPAIERRGDGRLIYPPPA